MSEILSQSLAPEVVGEIAELTGGAFRVEDIGDTFASMAEECFAGDQGIASEGMEDPQLDDLGTFAAFAAHRGKANAAAVQDVLEGLRDLGKSVEAVLLEAARNHKGKLTTERVVRAFALRAEVARKGVVSIAQECDGDSLDLPTNVLTNSKSRDTHQWLLDQYAFGWWQIMLAAQGVGSKVRGVSEILYDKLHQMDVYRFMGDMQASAIVGYIQARVEDGTLQVPDGASMTTYGGGGGRDEMALFQRGIAASIEYVDSSDVARQRARSRFEGNNLLDSRDEFVSQQFPGVFVNESHTDMFDHSGWLARNIRQQQTAPVDGNSAYSVYHFPAYPHGFQDLMGQIQGTLRPQATRGQGGFSAFSMRGLNSLHNRPHGDLHAGILLRGGGREDDFTYRHNPDGQRRSFVSPDRLSYDLGHVDGIEAPQIEKVEVGAYGVEGNPPQDFLHTLIRRVRSCVNHRAETRYDETSVASREPLVRV